MGDTVGPRYTAPKVSAISYLFRTFSLLIMGDTERPRYTGFRGLSVRGITALQCMTISWTNSHFSIAGPQVQGHSCTVAYGGGFIIFSDSLVFRVVFFSSPMSLPMGHRESTVENKLFKHLLL